MLAVLLLMLLIAMLVLRMGKTEERLPDDTVPVQNPDVEQLVQSLVLDLADAFACAADALADFLQRLGAVAVEAETQRQNRAFTLFEAVAEFDHVAEGLLVLHEFVRSGGLVVRNDVAEFAVFAMLDRIVEGDGGRLAEAEAGDGAFGQIDFAGDLLVRRITAEILREFRLGGLDFRNLGG